jgi:tetracycline resistance efflux pump
MDKRWLVFGGLLIVTLGVWLLTPTVGALWPSVAALVLVFALRNAVLGLLGGAVIGSFLLTGGNPLAVPMELVEGHFLPLFGSSWKTGAVAFTLLLGGFVHLLERGGILQGLFSKLLHGSSARKVEAGAGLFGLVCFFDGLANSLMVGRIFQPLARSAGVSRLRLAYIVDTTSAAVACLAFISTWIAFQLSMIAEGFALAGRAAEADPYGLFFASIPFNFYAWSALLLMMLVIWRQWNLGPMRAAAGVGPMEATDRLGGEAASEMPWSESWRVLLPLVVLVMGIFGGIYVDGVRQMEEVLWPIKGSTIAMAFAEARVPGVLVSCSALAALVAFWTFPRRELKDGEGVGGIFIEGMLHLFQPVLILLSAWMLSSVLQALGAGAVLGHLLDGRLPVWTLPVAVFATGMLVSFTTGTSWGTMGLLMPLAIPLVFSLAGTDAVAFSLMPVVVGAVFSGAVFGDHCSPLSDTTIVSSVACDVDPVDHVRTQLPYAGIAGAFAVLGFSLSGLLLS